MRRYILSLVLLILCGLHQTMSAQDVAVKTNGLYWLATTPNIGAEFALSNKWTAELTGAYNPWTFKDDKNFVSGLFNLKSVIGSVSVLQDTSSVWRLMEVSSMWVI